MSPENNLKSIARRTGVDFDYSEVPERQARTISHQRENRQAGNGRSQTHRLQAEYSCKQSLRTNKTYTIGLLIPSIDNPYFATIASEIVF